MGIPQTIQKFELYSVVLLQYPIPRLLVVVRRVLLQELQELSAGVRERIFLETDIAEPRTEVNVRHVHSHLGRTGSVALTTYCRKQFLRQARIVNGWIPPIQNVTPG